MFWTIIAAVVFITLLFMMALCKAAADADRRIDEMMRQREVEKLEKHSH